MNIFELAEVGQLFDLSGFPGNAAYYEDRVSLNALFDEELRLGRNVKIGAAIVGHSCYIGNNVDIGDDAFVGSETIVEDGVILGNSVMALGGNRINKDACLRDNVQLGEGVSISSEIQIGGDMIIPSTHAIMALGRFGESNRVVTIHGSKEGPRYSIGCQYSVDWDTIRHRITKSVETSAESASHYAQYLDVFNAAGAQVQKIFDNQADIVEAIEKEVFELQLGAEI